MRKLPWYEWKYTMGYGRHPFLEEEIRKEAARQASLLIRIKNYIEAIRCSHSKVVLVEDISGLPSEPQGPKCLVQCTKCGVRIIRSTDDDRID